MPSETQPQQETIKPVITFSSFEEEEEEDYDERDERSTSSSPSPTKSRKPALKKVESLNVPTFINVEAEAKRPPL